jgi:hypothetical protein
MEVDLSSGRRREDRCIGKIGGLGLLARGVDILAILKKRKVFFKKIKKSHQLRRALFILGSSGYVATS